MTGADRLAVTLADLGIDTCFANPGTTEMHILAALGREPRIRQHLCLFEGVATGAADGYARMTGRPALTLLHLGPGFANGMANLHNAKKADSAILNIVGEHALAHLDHEAPLTADIMGMAATVSDLCATARTADTLAAEAATLIAGIEEGAGRVATLVVPNDVAWSAAEAVEGQAPRTRPAPRPQANAAAQAAEALRRPGALLFLGGAHISARAIRLAIGAARATGAQILTEATVARMARGGGLPDLRRLPFHVDHALEALSGVRHCVLIGSRAPVAFFAYPDRPSRLLPEAAEVLTYAPPRCDLEAALEALAAEIGCGEAALEPGEPPRVPEGPLDPASLAGAVAAALPDGAVVIDEAMTEGFRIFPATKAAASHDWLSNRGGSIGFALPAAVGAAVACPDRKVLCISGDGSAIYTNQALWTMARAGLDVTVLILANDRYSILMNETSKIGAGAPTAETTPLMDLTEPRLDWLAMAASMGVPAERVTEADALHAALARTMAQGGPHLIEARL